MYRRKHFKDVREKTEYINESANSLPDDSGVFGLPTVSLPDDSGERLIPLDLPDDSGNW